MMQLDGPTWARFAIWMAFGELWHIKSLTFKSVESVRQKRKLLFRMDALN